MRNYDPDFVIEKVVYPSARTKNLTEGFWISTNVSIDHKPDRKDEKERILKFNGRVDTFRDTNGEMIGPYRVWLKDENVPGLAMSWSLGDFVAQSVGVSPEPGNLSYLTF